MSQNLLEAKFCAKPSGSSPARPWFAMSTLVPRFTRPSSAPAKLSHLMRRGSHAQSLLAMRTVVARAMKTPARHTGCGKKEQPVRRSPMRNAALRRARFVVPLPPSPAAPTQTTPAELSCPVLNAPALSRLQCGTCTAPTLGAGWCRVAAKRLPWCRASLDFFESLTGSPQALPAADTTMAPRAIRPHAVGVTRQNVAAGHFPRAPNFWLRRPACPP